MFKYNALIAENLHDRDVIKSVFRSYLLHPVHVIIILFLGILRLLGFMVPEFPALGVVGDVVFYLARMAAYIWLALRLMPVVVPWLMVRNIPFTWATYLFFLPLLTGYLIVFHSVMPETDHAGAEVAHYVRVVSYSLFAHGSLMVMVHSIVTTRIGRVPDLVPFNLPVTVTQQSLPHAGLISNELTGRVRALKAQNQYVEVMTDYGNHLLRMTLRNAIDRLPPASGVQIHRSWWVSRAELAIARHDPHKAVFHAGEGRIYPVGKTYAAELAQRSAADRA